MGAVARRRPGYIVVTATARKEGVHFVSWCPEFDISSCGDTEEAALANLRDALLLYIDTAEREGELERIFSERGIEIQWKEEPIMASNFHISQLTVRVPTPV